MIFFYCHNNETEILESIGLYKRKTESNSGFLTDELVDHRRFDGFKLPANDHFRT